MELVSNPLRITVILSRISTRTIHNCVTEICGIFVRRNPKD